MPRDPVRDTYAMALADDPLDGGAVRDLRFGVALRGYAMDQVDAVLDRLAAELDARDARIAELTAQVGPTGSGAVGVAGGVAPAPQRLPAETWDQPR